MSEEVTAPEQKPILAKGDEFVTAGYRWKVEETDGHETLIVPTKKLGNRRRKPRKKVTGRNKARR